MLAALVRARAPLRQLLLSPLVAAPLTAVAGLGCRCSAPALGRRAAVAMRCGTGQRLGGLRRRAPWRRVPHGDRLMRASARRAGRDGRSADADARAARTALPRARSHARRARDPGTRMRPSTSSSSAPRAPARAPPSASCCRRRSQRGDRAVIADPDGGYLRRLLRRRARRCDPQSLRCPLGRVGSVRRDPATPTTSSSSPARCIPDQEGARSQLARLCAHASSPPSPARRTPRASRDVRRALSPAGRGADQRSCGPWWPARRRSRSSRSTTAACSTRSAR